MPKRYDFDLYDPEIGVDEDVRPPEPKPAVLEAEGPTVCNDCGRKRAFELVLGVPVCRTCQITSAIGD